MHVVAAVLFLTACLAAKDNKNDVSKRNRVPTLSDKEYQALLNILARPLSERAKTKEDGALYRKAKKRGLQRERILDTYRGEEVERLTREGLILLPPAEVDSCISFYRKQSLGDGSEKLWDSMKTKYYGVSRDRILAFLRKSETHFQQNPSFKNEAPFQPVRASQVMERHQIDLVDLTCISSRQKGKDRYVLALLDCFSRFLWMRSIPDKSAATVVKRLKEIYLEFGVPKYLQSDQGNEFRGEVEKLCRDWNIRIIRSRPHHPESQGKIERSHRTWKTKLRSLVHGLLNETPIGDMDWTQALPYIARTYNTGRHTAIKMSPYECLFGIKSNFVIQGYEGGLCEDILENHDIEEEVEAHDVSSTDPDDNADCYETRKRHFSDVRLQASESDAKQSKRMVERHQREHTANVYEVGEIVLVRCGGRDKRVKRGGLSLAKPKVYHGMVRSRKRHMYSIILISKDRRGEYMQVNVNDITSLTSEEERAKREKVFDLKTKGKLGSALSKVGEWEHRGSFGSRASGRSSSSGTSGMDMLLENSALQGLVLDSDNSGDGNCMFHALQQQLERNGIRKNHKAIRTEIVQFLSENTILGEGRDAVFLPDFVMDYDSWEEYLENLSQDGVWGDNIALLAAAHLYQISICVVSSLQDSEPVVIESSDGVTLFDIYLGHIAEMHYVTLQPQQREQCSALVNQPRCCHLSSNQARHPHNDNVQASPDSDSIARQNDTEQRCTGTSATSKKRICNCTGQASNDDCTLQSLCDHLLLFIFALATMYSDKTTSSISLSCKRFNALVKTQEFRDKQFQEWLKRVRDWSQVDRTHREEFLYSRKSATVFLLCKNCGREFPSQSGWQRGPDGLQRFYWTDEFCSNHCEWALTNNTSA